MIFKPTNGVNLRLPASEVGVEQAVLMQNYDWTHSEQCEQIPGSSKYHGNTIGTNAPTAIMVNYNEAEDKQDVLVCVDDKIYKKNFGSNEFQELLSGLTPNQIRFGTNINDKSYIIHPKDGFFEYDGVSKITKLITNSTAGTSINLKDIISSKETNRCFGITANNELVWTDSLATIGGVPIQWAALNVDTQFPTNGDEPIKLFILSGRLIVLRTNSIWFYYILGTPSQWRPEKVDFSGGCIAPLSAKQVGREIWFFGYSAESGRGVYAIDGNGNVRLLSLDIEPVLDRINQNKIMDVCAEHVGNLYKFSFALDAETENNWTFHFDTISLNKETGSPNIYGPHTYGFSASCVLNTTKFKGEHLFARKHTDGARVFKVGDYRTQYSDELVDNGSLIPTILISPIISDEQIGKTLYDVTWMKRYSDFYIDCPPKGSWHGTVEVLKGFESETFESYEQYLQGDGYPLEAVSLGSDPIDYESVSSDQDALIDANFVSDAIQFKISNYNVNEKHAFRSLRYEAKPERKKKNVQIISI